MQITTTKEKFVPKCNFSGSVFFYLSHEQAYEHLMINIADGLKSLGVPFYGRAFKLENPHDSRMGARARSTSFAGPYTREDGFLGYNEICEVIMCLL